MKRGSLRKPPACQAGGFAAFSKEKRMWIAALIAVASFLGFTLGVIFGINAANTTRIVESTSVRHTKDFNRALRDIDLRLAALPEELIDAVREAFPQLYNGPNPRR